jgi:hypothetical protein
MRMFKKCVCFLLYDRWANRILQRVRRYHSLRKESCIRIQCMFRQKVAQSVALQRKRLVASTTIQCFVRRGRAKRVLKERRRERATVRIQRIYRGYIGRMRFTTLLRALKAQQLCRWFRQHRLQKRTRAAFRIQFRVRKWLVFRHKCLQKLRRVATKFLLRRKRNAICIQRYVCLLFLAVHHMFRLCVIRAVFKSNLFFVCFATVLFVPGSVTSSIVSRDS